VQNAAVDKVTVWLVNFDVKRYQSIIKIVYNRNKNVKNVLIKNKKKACKTAWMS